MKRIVLMVALVALGNLLTGCATNSTPVTFAESKPVPPDRIVLHSKPEPGTYPVQIKRDMGFSWGMACMYELDVDGEKSAFINEGEKLTFFLAAGQHVLNVGRVMTGTLKPSKVRCYSEAPLEFPLIVESNRPNKFRLYNPEAEGTHFSPTATE